MNKLKLCNDDENGEIDHEQERNLSNFSSPSSTLNNSVIQESDLMKRFREKDSKVTFKVYLNFFFNNKMNYLLVPLTLFLLVLA